jgi:hypothetical protein
MIYQDAKRHFEGHEAKDVLFHHQNLQQFSPNLKITFKADAVRLDDLFRRVEEVTHQPLTDIYTLQQGSSSRCYHPHPDHDAYESHLRDHIQIGL